MRFPQLSSSDGGGSAGNLGTIGPSPSADDIATFLAEDDDSSDVDDNGDKGKKESKEEIEIVDEDDKEKLDLKDKEDKKDKKKDDKDDEEELEDDEKEEKDEDVEIDAPPRKKELVAAYPDLFKKFPFLEKMLYRDKQYSELFGSFDDAKEAHEKIESYEHFENLLADGNTEEVLKSIKEGDSKAFDKVVDSYLMTLHKVDKDAYFEVIGNVGKRFIEGMANEAKKSDNDELRQAALLLNQFLFGKSEYEPPKPRVQEEKNDELKKIENERKALNQERFDSARTELQGKVDNILRNTISTYIDPREMMSGFVKKHAVDNAIKYLTEALGSDQSLTRNLNNLWKSANEAKYSKDSLSKIQSAYLGRAKNLATAAIKKARIEALKDSTPRERKVSEEKEENEREEREETETPRKRNITPGRPSSHKKDEKMEKGETVLDYFSR